jgi:Flp pilus assembly protein TadG
MRLRSPKPQRRQGAAIVEMAIVLPFIALMFLVACDFCRVFFCTQTLQGCAQAAVENVSGYARVAPTTTQAQAAFQAALAEGASLNPPLTAANVNVTVVNNVATVTITYDFSTLTGYPGLPNPLTIVRSVSLRMAPQAGQGS